MGARLDDSAARVDQLSLAQKVLLAAYTMVAVLTLAIPNYPVFWAAVEMCIMVFILLSTWWDFVKFALASNEAFGLVVSSLRSKRKHGSPGQVDRAATLEAKKVVTRAKSLKRVMQGLLFGTHMMFLIYVLFSSVWLINLPGVCNARSVDKDPRHIVETIRFCVCDVCHVAVVMCTWTNIYVFTGAARRKKRMKRSTKMNTAIVPPLTGYSNATSAALN
jgi:hypothetical protein